ncbi:cadmium efflux system accessory protein [Corynebacterium humireducens NBRC 106098 = DSM 45392]|uniref:Cadmium efflux system accessory protein n=1 Tax=Corynebacterium humireducens NBRC 106098 = DSM 45392 TaxID=1223515 RepID=A0A0B5D9Q4_9CORY|nr:metalloregulator ArsR/SmtB family transcription factor [Corynebacterium humireducens]AJE33732.1 cadmium efflux system accessory protein [Corynebacterium humireducens NBRC 106098 = DSM 45392]
MNTYSDTDLDAAEVIIGALDSRLRVQIIWRLSIREHFVHELVDGLQKSQPLISQHLRVLKRSGIVDSERRGREVIYRLVLPQAADLIGAAVTLGLHAREMQAAQTTTNGRTDERSPLAAVVQIGHTDEARGSGTEEDVVGQVAHAPAAAAAAPGLETIPDPSPTPPVPASFS